MTSVTTLYYRSIEMPKNKQCDWCKQEITEGEQWVGYKGHYYHSHPVPCFRLFDQFEAEQNNPKQHQD